MVKNTLVLNLIITGIPSILPASAPAPLTSGDGFKPYYNWNTFNTRLSEIAGKENVEVLNLIITGIPSILLEYNQKWLENNEILNLIITGIPSIPLI